MSTRNKSVVCAQSVCTLLLLWWVACYAVVTGETSSTGNELSQTPESGYKLLQSQAAVIQKFGSQVINHEFNESDILAKLSVLEAQERMVLLKIDQNSRIIFDTQSNQVIAYHSQREDPFAEIGGVAIPSEKLLAVFQECIHVPEYYGFSTDLDDYEVTYPLTGTVAFRLNLSVNNVPYRQSPLTFGAVLPEPRLYLINYRPIVESPKIPEEKISRDEALGILNGFLSAHTVFGSEYAALKFPASSSKDITEVIAFGNNYFADEVKNKEGMQNRELLPVYCLEITFELNFKMRTIEYQRKVCAWLDLRTGEVIGGQEYDLE